MTYTAYFKSYFLKYNTLIVKKPLLTNMITTGFLFGSGDMLAQTLFRSPLSNGDTDSFDYSRLFRAVIYGSVIFAPIGDKWYKLLNKIKFPTTGLVKNGGKKELPKFKPQVLHVKEKANIKDTLLRVSFDQLIFAPFIGIPLYYTMMTIFETIETNFQTPLQANTAQPSIWDIIMHKLNTNWWNTLRSNWIVWPIFQLFNFYLIPVQYRLLVVNSLSIGWNCYLSYVLNRKDLLMLQGQEQGQSILEPPVKDDGMIY